MNQWIRLVGVVFLALLVSACATLDSARAPGADLGRIKTVYVERHEKDERGVDKLIAAQLEKLGMKASSGAPGGTGAEGADALVTYADRWMWDITMYMLSLDVQVRDPRTRAMLASGRAYRPSLVRKSPEGMVEEVVTSVFKP